MPEQQMQHILAPYNQNIHRQAIKPEIKQQMQRKQIPNQYLQNNIQELENKMIYDQLPPKAPQPKRKRYKKKRKTSVSSNKKQKNIQNEVLIQDQGYQGIQQQYQQQQMIQQVQVQQQPPMQMYQQQPMQQQMQQQIQPIQLMQVPYGVPNAYQQPPPNNIGYQIEQTGLGNPIKKFNKQDFQYYKDKYDTQKPKKRKKRKRKKDRIRPKEINFEDVDILQNSQVYPIQQMMVQDPQLQYGYYPQPVNYPGQQLQKYQLNEEEFHPYNINDYRKWKKNQGKHRAGRLAVNKKTKDYKQKISKMNKMKEYSNMVKNQNKEKRYVYREQRQGKLSKQERMKHYVNNIQRPWDRNRFIDPYDNNQEYGYIPEYDPQSNPNRLIVDDNTTLQETTDFFDNPNSEDEI